MPVTILCPTLKCRAVLQVSDKTRGKKVRCSQCGTAFVVPAAKVPVLEPINPADSPPQQAGGSDD